ncbi:GntR family transcriptional regulator [Psychromonas algicola]|uniref:GntR family transcriptional regulator n=1 Tax=Psychromonas algicola TaxID=2555642 RepID=UPI001067FA26|nr:winged helix-turn-helix domain-containing protein [Psychromonas sp. RZ5]TEW50214.1 GntR family transcriptional regulator [Psychromonas sp. RZ5]
MINFLMDIELHRNSSYQKQIKAKLIELIKGNAFANNPLPSGRKMAEQLKVSRNTVVAVYESLVDDSYLVARTRSGFYVHPDFLMVHSMPKLVQTSQQGVSNSHHQNLQIS